MMKISAMMTAGTATAATGVPSSEASVTPTTTSQTQQKVIITLLRGYYDFVENFI